MNRSIKSHSFYYLVILVLIISFSNYLLYADDTQDMEYIQKLYQNKYYKEAVDELQLFVKKHIDSSHYNSALNLLAVCYYNLNKLNNAKTILEELLQTEYKNSALFYLEMIAIKENQMKKAEEYLKLIDKKNRIKPEACFLLADKYYDNHIYEKAEKYYKQVLKYKGDYYNKALFKLSSVYYKNQEYIKTIAVLEEYIQNVKKHPNLQVVYYLLGVSNEKIKDWERAITHYKIVEKDYYYTQYLSRSLYNMVKIYNKRNDYKNLKAYSKKLLNSEYEREALILLAEFEYKQKKYKEAEDIYKKLLPKDKDKKICYKLILSLIKQEKYDETLRFLVNIKKTAYFSEYYYYTAFILFKQKKYQELIKKIDIDEKNIDKNYINDIYLFLAESASKIKDHKKAEKYYKKLYNYTHNKKDLYQLFLITYQQKNIQKSKNYFQEYQKTFIQDKDYKKDFYSSMAELYIEDKQYQQAETIYKNYLRATDDDIVLNNLVAVLLKQNKHEEIIKYLGDKKNTTETMYMKGLAYSGKHEYAKAVEIFENIIKKEKNDYTEKSYIKLCESFFSLKQYDKVIQVTSQYLQKKYQKFTPDIIEKKGLAYFRKKDYSHAIITYKELIQYPEKKDYAYFMLGEIYYNQKEFKQAKKNYLEIQKIPDSEYKKMSLYWLINITYQNREYDEALKYSKLFLNKYKKGDYIEEIVYYMGEIYLSQNKYKSAVSEYNRLYKISTDRTIKENVIKSLVKIYMDQKKYSKALRWVKKSKHKSFKTLWMGIIYEKQRKTKLAVVNYKKLLNDKENGDKANYYLGNYYLKKKKYDQARIYLEKVAEFKTSEYKDDALLKTALSYEAEKNYSRAVLTLMKIKLIYENSPFQDIVHLKLGENYEKLELLEKAIPLYQEFHQKHKTSPYYEQVVERLLVYYVNQSNKDKAIIYYNELKKMNPKKAGQYKKYF